MSNAMRRTVGCSVQKSMALERSGDPLPVLVHVLAWSRGKAEAAAGFERAGFTPPPAGADRHRGRGYVGCLAEPVLEKQPEVGGALVGVRLEPEVHLRELGVDILRLPHLFQRTDRDVVQFDLGILSLEGNHATPPNEHRQSNHGGIAHPQDGTYSTPRTVF